MFEEICTVIFFLGLGMIVFGIDQIFTVKFGEKWYPGLSVSLWKISDESSRKLIWIGFVITVIALAFIAIF